MDAASWNETEIISRAQTGDRDAFSELVRRHHTGVIDAVYRMCGDPFLAEDAAQSAFLKAWMHLPEFQPGTSFRAWLYRIAINAGLDMLRRAKPESVWEEARDAAAPDSLEDAVVRRERAQWVRRSVLALPEASRAVLILREYRGLSYREISESLEIPVGTVMSRLNYARTLLAETLRSATEER